MQKQRVWSIVINPVHFFNQRVAAMRMLGPYGEPNDFDILINSKWRERFASYNYKLNN